MNRKTLIRKFKKTDACEEGLKWLEAQKEADVKKLFIKAVKEGHYNWANWAIVRIMTYKQCVAYACYAARQVLDIYKKEYPDDKRSRKAIEAAEKCIKSPTNKNKDAANAAARVAWVSARAAGAAKDSAGAAAAAAWAAAKDSAGAAANAACAATIASGADKKLQLKIIRYGLKLLGDK